MGLVVLGWCIAGLIIPLDFAIFYELAGVDSVAISDVDTSGIENRPNFSLWVFSVYTIVYFFLGMREFRTVFERNRDGTKWHSYYHGDTRFSFVENLSEVLGLNESIGQHIIGNHIVKLYIEPLFFMSAGLVSIWFLPMIGAWFLTGGVVLLIKGHIMYTRLRNEYLDQRDSAIESRNMRGAMEGKKSRETEGFSTLALRPRGLHSTTDTTQAMREMFEEHPELAEMASRGRKEVKPKA